MQNTSNTYSVNPKTVTNAKTDDLTLLLLCRNAAGSVQNGILGSPGEPFENV